MAKGKVFKKINSRLILGISLTVAVPLAANSVALGATYATNRSIDSEKKTAVFTSGHDEISNKSSPAIAKLIDFFMYPPVTLRQNLRGYHVDWYSDAPCDTIMEKLSNPEYDNVVFIGHGNSSQYAASDGSISSWDIVISNIPKKEGEFLQHTCGGGGNEISLRDALLEDTEKGYSYDQPISAFENYSKAVIELFKEINRKF
ncbi:MAG: hypothetical protein ABIB71_01305 [Candidatus Woesearchaeota archaeon]